MITLASFLDASPTVEEVDRRIESLEDELHKLRYYRNQHSTVSRLPTEILASIFKVVALSEGFSRGSLKKTNLRHGRLVITHVCKRWRDIAITNPQIWCIVYTSMRRELAQLFVERSRSLSLYIATDLNTSRHSEDTIKYLLTHSTRIWRLEMWNCPPEAVEGLTQLKAPMLKQVSLTVDDDRHQASKMTFLSADPDVPPLRYLSLRNVLFDLDSPFLSQLRTLKLYYTYLVLPEEYHQKLLPFLSRLQRLRHLELDGAIVPSPTHLEDPVVEMPSLFTLQLRPANLRPTLRVLDHLSLPSLRFFNLTINVVTNSEILLPLRATLYKMIPHIESPHVRVDITHNFPSKFESYMSVWSHADRAEDATPTFRISISNAF
ncbi:hypothetical protein ONZ45_g19041 [Pleurotus djamor]|nr:hypothetical protein ONZ45_g19041 [Pleurotus djamor]